MSKIIDLEKLQRFKNNCYNQVLKKGKNFFSRDFGSFENGFLQSDGSLTVTGDYATSPFVYLPQGTYTLSLGLVDNTKRIVIRGYNLSKQTDSTVYGYTNDINIRSKTFTMLKNGFIRFCSQLKNSNFNLGILNADIQIESGENVTEYEQYYLDIKNKEPLNIINHFDNTVNLVNPDDIKNGYVVQANGTITALSNYSVSGFIKIKNGSSYVIKGRARHIFIGSLTGDPRTYISTAQTDYQFTASYDGYLRYTIYGGEESTAMVVESSTVPTTFIPYGFVPKDNVYLSQTLIEQATKLVGGGVLNGKKYVACGDSFTAGGYSSSDGFPESVYIYQEGEYVGKQKTYPYMIGLRNNMTVENMAISGRTLASTNQNNSFVASQQYKNIPNDADYITLKFGINDSHQLVPIGTIDSVDTTTFYGAWNVVMSYIIENYPNAKIGIIVSNGCDSADYPNATRNIAKKYGIPYLDEVEGENVPLLIRANRTGVPSSIQNIRNIAFRVTSTNLHPNVACQEYESTFVENFLRTL